MKPDIFEYLDYKEYLQELFKYTKTSKKALSQRYISSKVGSSSVGWFGDIIKGRRRLMGEYIPKLAFVFELKPREEEYLDLLCQFANAENHLSRDRIYNRILYNTKCKPEVLSYESLEYFKYWWHAAIREIIVAEGFNGNAKTLAKRLIPSVSLEEVEASILLQEKLGFLKKVAGGCFEAAQAHLTKDNSTAAVHFYNYFKSNAQVGLLALDNFPKEERDFSSLTLTLDEEQFEEVRNEVTILRDKIRNLSQKQTKKGRVFQCLFQVFPLSQS
jgi:uncharacterized protein (TIGR02147 family)